MLRREITAGQHPTGDLLTRVGYMELLDMDEAQMAEIEGQSALPRLVDMSSVRGITRRQ